MKHLSKRVALLSALVASSTLSQAVRADPSEPVLEQTVPARLILGVKFGGGGTLWDEPGDVPKLADGQSILPIFEETRGGYTMSAGFHIGGIFFDHLGLDLGFHFVKHTLLEQIDWSFTEIIDGQAPTVRRAESDTELAWTALHLPILLKAVIPAGSTRVTLGVGPEFAFNSWAKTVFDITETDEPPGPNGEVLLPGERSVFRTVSAKLEDSVYLTVNFGIEFTAGDFIIPVDLHWSYNLSQQPNYLDRALLAEDEIPSASNPDPEPTAVTLETRDSMYGGIRIGLSYQF
jgi:hypothetical protein